MSDIPRACARCGEPFRDPHNYHRIGVDGAIYDAATCFACEAVTAFHRVSPRELSPLSCAVESTYGTTPMSCTHPQRVNIIEFGKAKPIGWQCPDCGATEGDV